MKGRRRPKDPAKERILEAYAAVIRIGSDDAEAAVRAVALARGAFWQCQNDACNGHTNTYRQETCENCGAERDD